MFRNYGKYFRRGWWTWRRQAIRRGRVRVIGFCIVCGDKIDTTRYYEEGNPYFVPTIPDRPWDRLDTGPRHHGCDPQRPTR